MNSLIFPSSLILPHSQDTLLIAFLIMKSYITTNTKKARRPSKPSITIPRNTDSQGLLPKTLEFAKQQIEESAPPSLIQKDQMYFIPLLIHSPKQITPYSIFHCLQGAPIPKLQSDIISNQEAQGSQEGSQQTQKQKGQHQLTKKPKKENINTGHWSTEEHTTYIGFLQQYESIMTSSMMKKTSKIFKQMSELIGTRTPSQCRSHHQKFNPYALRGENGKRLPRSERSRAGRKKKNPSCDIPKAEEVNLQQHHFDQEQLMMMYDKQLLHPIPYEQWNPYYEMHQPIKKEEDQDQENSQQIQLQIHNQQDYEEFVRLNYQKHQMNIDYIECHNSIVNEY
ncbi:unnamed protein product (macronuclear) [Paramecium tetraurelia]|uniref:Myb-like domain-containing protein n=1 Tax=Paramecium tetraurelia TaxID=5888 RepID=A0DV17_PARTE|nr:uncharacterized protein GSPATT00020546001 [Paramecium tetraurelia]CAK86884.1 unnamed protein product [Paramecium tetraurelia]|eukprot:XP_001454281.1 hypothetical protein (macronuclear) [Paramecium tetraurelia strain d4-2]